MANPLSHLPTNFKDLTKNQIFEVMQHYCDENRYPYIEPNDSRTTPRQHFESNYHSYGELIQYFKNWQH